MVETTEGLVPVLRLGIDTPFPAQPSLPNLLPPDQPSTSSGQSVLRTKIRTKGNRARANSAQEAYPLSVQHRITRARELLENQSEQQNSPRAANTENFSEESEPASQLPREPRNRHNQRDSKGKYSKKSREQKPDSDN